MPTAYTMRVHEGKAVELSDYMRDCAKAFLWEYRDAPWDTPLPTEPRFRQRILDEKLAQEKAAVDEIYALEGMTDAACEEAAKARHAEQMADADRIDQRSTTERDRLQAMHDKVRAWAAPAPLAELRKFMLDQLQESGLRWNDKPWPRASLLSGAEWREQQRERLQRRLTSAREDVAKQRQSLSRETEWLALLHEALA